jgi:hypothetical protein
MLGICFWREGSEAALGPERRGAKGGWPPSFETSTGVSHRSLKQQWLDLIDMMVNPSVCKTPLTPRCHPLWGSDSVSHSNCRD